MFGLFVTAGGGSIGGGDWRAKWDDGFIRYAIKKMQFLKYFVGHLDY